MRRLGEPVLGWRLWRVSDGRLQSWAVNHYWQPGQNVATCRSSERICAAAPGQRCQCGLWARWSPLQCLSLASNPIEPPWYVVGLIAAWGEVAIHGREGFRAERASVLCVFTDWAGAAPVPQVATGKFTRWANAMLDNRLMRGRRWRADPDPIRIELLQRVARQYAVPLVSLRAALESRLLSEWGVPPDQLREVEAWVAALGVGGRD